MCTMYGTLWAIQLTTGETLMPTQAQRTVSEALDAIANLPGYLMFRGADIWTPIAPGTPGQVLTWDAATNVPKWTTPPP